MRRRSKSKTLDKIETSTIPVPMILGNNPHSFVIHAKYAMTGDRKANIVQPITNVQP